ncbi:Vacuolar protein sorting-associated protein 37C [Cichlidogyrus casuarinus]|uniref:Vacuolar protein sorting-associated protein 37C n=1 Tax=Cichlidogyrus casuarinus TaxID=1844966 RepID=A0ABD2QL38_9PLAT
MYPGYPLNTSYNGVSLTNFDSVISKLSIDEVKDTFTDPEKIKEIVMSSDELMSLMSRKTQLLEENKAIAAENLKTEPSLLEKKTALADLHNKLKEAMDTYSMLKTRIDSHSTRQSPSTVHALLQAASVEAEEESDKIFEAFLSKEIDIDTFIKEFIPKRSLYNERHVKAEKLSQQLSAGTISSGMELQQQTIAPPTIPYPEIFQGPRFPMYP